MRVRDLVVYTCDECHERFYDSDGYLLGYDDTYSIYVCPDCVIHRAPELVMSPDLDEPE